MTQIYRAGLIPAFIEDDEIIMLFMKPSDSKYGGPDFQIAKGKIETKETNVEAAIREAGEELGLKTNNIVELHNLGSWLGRTTFFIGLVKDKTAFGDFHFETGDTKWMTLNEFMESGRPIHKGIVKYAHKTLTTYLGANQT